MSSTPAPLVALTTGVTTEVGRLVAQVLANRGYHLAVEAGGSTGEPEKRDAATGRALRELLRRGARATAANHDLSTADGAAVAIRSALEAFGRLDLLVTCPQLDRERSLARVDEASLRELIDHHLLETTLMCQAATREMVPRGGGRVICLTGTAGAPSASFGQAHLAAVMAGIGGLVRALAVELSHKKIAINALALPTRSSSVELELTGVEPAIEFLISPAASAITGQVIALDGARVSVIRSVTSTGAVATSGAWTAESIALRWGELSR